MKLKAARKTNKQHATNRQRMWAQLIFVTTGTLRMSQPSQPYIGTSQPYVRHNRTYVRTFWDFHDTGLQHLRQHDQCNSRKSAKSCFACRSSLRSQLLGTRAKMAVIYSPRSSQGFHRPGLHKDFMENQLAGIMMDYLQPDISTIWKFGMGCHVRKHILWPRLWNENSIRAERVNCKTLPRCCLVSCTNFGKPSNAHRPLSHYIKYQISHNSTTNIK